MSRRKPVTLDEVKAAFLAVNGSRTNPHREGSCLYNDPKDPDRHCIAGQILCDLGFEKAVKDLRDRLMPVTAVASCSGFAAFKNAQPSVGLFLNTIQTVADNGFNCSGGQAAAVVRGQEGDAEVRLVQWLT